MNPIGDEVDRYFSSQPKLAPVKMVPARGKRKRIETPDEARVSLRRRAADGTVVVPVKITEEEKAMISEETLRELGLIDTLENARTK